MRRLSRGIIFIIGSGVLLAACFFFFFSFAYGASGVPKILSYQGRLTDASGNLLGGSGTSYNFRFSIYGSSSGGSQLWPGNSATPCTHALTVKEGVFRSFYF